MAVLVLRNKYSRCCQLSKTRLQRVHEIALRSSQLPHREVKRDRLIVRKQRLQLMSIMKISLKFRLVRRRRHFVEGSCRSRSISKCNHSWYALLSSQRLVTSNGGYFYATTMFISFPPENRFQNAFGRKNTCFTFNKSVYLGVKLI